VLLHPEGVLLLNETGAAIIRLCDGVTGVSGIAAALSDRYAGVIPHEVEDFLDRLAGLHLLERASDPPTGGGSGTPEGTVDSARVTGGRRSGARR
jgi:pyrroloquinoline quinone biosynthesis protein D